MLKKSKIMNFHCDIENLTDVTRLNFFEVACAAFFSKYYSLVRGTRRGTKLRAPD